MCVCVLVDEFSLRLCAQVEESLMFFEGGFDVCERENGRACAQMLYKRVMK